MKTKAYIRVGWDKDAERARARAPKIDANAVPITSPLCNSRGEPVPTVCFAVELDLPDAMFERAATVIAELAVSEEEAEIAMQVRQK